MIWDATQRRYEDENGQALTPAQVRNYIQEFIDSEKAEVRAESERLFNQEISVPEFFAFMRQKITAWHSVAGQVAYGGEKQMNG